MRYYQTISQAKNKFPLLLYIVSSYIRISSPSNARAGKPIHTLWWVACLLGWRGSRTETPCVMGEAIEERQSYPHVMKSCILTRLKEVAYLWHRVLRERQLKRIELIKWLVHITSVFHIFGFVSCRTWKFCNLWCGGQKWCLLLTIFMRICLIYVIFYVLRVVELISSTISTFTCKLWHLRGREGFIMDDINEQKHCG